MISPTPSSTRAGGLVIGVAVAASLAAAIGMVVGGTGLALLPFSLVTLVVVAALARGSWDREARARRRRVIAAALLAGSWVLVTGGAMVGSGTLALVASVPALCAVAAVLTGGPRRGHRALAVAACVIPALLLGAALPGTGAAGAQGAASSLAALDLSAAAGLVGSRAGAALLGAGVVLLASSLVDLLSRAARLRHGPTLAALAAVLGGHAALLGVAAGVAVTGADPLAAYRLGATGALVGLGGVYAAWRGVVALARRDARVGGDGPLVLVAALAACLAGGGLLLTGGAAVLVPPTLAWLAGGVGAIAGLCFAGALVHGSVRLPRSLLRRLRSRLARWARMPAGLRPGRLGRGAPEPSSPR